MIVNGIALIYCTNVQMCANIKRDNKDYSTNSQQV